MNLELYNKLMEQKLPQQHPPEWLVFLEICERYLKEHKIENPIVVELGARNDDQKRFWEQILGAYHIGIDFSSRRNNPDILGNTHDPETLKILKEKLKGRPINILFIDAGHCYESVKQDFEMYSPSCKDIIAFHDIETYRYESGKERGVSIFWDELRKIASTELGKYENFLFLTIYQCTFMNNRKQMGIGMMIKR